MTSEVLVNSDIRSVFKNNDDRVRLVGEDGEQLGIVKFAEAMNTAVGRNLDLILVSAQASPPVCKILDFGKHQYEQKKRAKELARKARESAVELKEIQLRPVTDSHDLAIKTKQARRFLDDGDKVKIVVRFKGREVTHMDKGRAVLDKMLADLGEFKFDRPVEAAGNSLITILSAAKK